MAGDVSHHVELQPVVGVNVSSARHAAYAREFAFQIAEVGILRSDSKLAAETHNPQVRAGLQSAEARNGGELRAQIEFLQPGIVDFRVSAGNQPIRAPIE